jgi:hypothetical protein
MLNVDCRLLVIGLSCPVKQLSFNNQQTAISHAKQILLP